VDLIVFGIFGVRSINPSRTILVVLPENEARFVKIITMWHLTD